MRGYGNSNRWVAHTHEVIGELEGMTATLAQTEAAWRGFLATGESIYLEERDAALSRQQSHLQFARAAHCRQCLAATAPAGDSPELSSGERLRSMT